MKNSTIYYPRIKRIVFYDSRGRVTSGMAGGIAKTKFRKMVMAGLFPRISLATKVKWRIEN